MQRQSSKQSEQRSNQLSQVRLSSTCHHCACLSPWLYYAELLEAQAQGHWESFYKRHGAAFFKDRHYLHREFPELLAGPLTLLEVGAL